MEYLLLQWTIYYYKGVFITPMNYVLPRLAIYYSNNIFME